MAKISVVRFHHGRIEDVVLPEDCYIEIFDIDRMKNFMINNGHVCVVNGSYIHPDSSNYNYNQGKSFISEHMRLIKHGHFHDFTIVSEIASEDNNGRTPQNKLVFQEDNIIPGIHALLSLDTLRREEHIPIPEEIISKCINIVASRKIADYTKDPKERRQYWILKNNKMIRALEDQIARLKEGVSQYEFYVPKPVLPNVKKMIQLNKDKQIKEQEMTLAYPPSDQSKPDERIFVYDHLFNTNEFYRNLWDNTEFYDPRGFTFVVDTEEEILYIKKLYKYPIDTETNRDIDIIIRRPEHHNQLIYYPNDSIIRENGIKPIDYDSDADLQAD